MSTEQKIKLSIIIVSYNVKVLLNKCLDSLSAQIPDFRFEVIVVDNKSTDGSQTMLAKRDDIELILSNQNLGFARGNNLGLEHAKGEYVLFLNPDTEVMYGSLAQMVAFMDSNSRYEALGPKLLNSDNSVQRSVRNFPTLSSQVIIMLKLHNIIRHIKPVRDYFRLDFDYSRMQEVDQVMGAALLVRKWVIDELQGFDQRFKRIFEEVDLCKRIKATGYQICYYSDASIIHHKGASFHGANFQPSLRRQVNFNRDMLYYFRKHMPWWHSLILALLLPVNLLLTSLTLVLGKLMPSSLKLKNRQL